MPPFPRLALCALIALPLTACGSSDSSSGGSSSGGARTAKSPQQILADVESAVSKVHSYHIVGTETDKDGRAQLTGDVAAPGSLRATLRQSARTAQIVVTGSTTYLRANQAFWRSEGTDAKVLKLLTDRWVKIPASASGDVSQSVAEFMPRNLGHCLATQTGTVTRRGTSRFAGQPVVILEDKGDKPGTNAGQLYVAASGPALPVRVVQTGRQRPGGANDPRCGGRSDSNTTAADIRLTNFDKPVKIAAPPRALDLQKLAAGGGANSA